MSIFKFLKKLFFEDVPETSSPLDESIIISCYFNPMKSPWRRKAFDTFFEGIKGYNYKIVECVIGDSQPELPDFIEKVYTKSLLWHKETLLNNIIKSLPSKYKYIFWLDADIIFTNPNWLEESVNVMKAGANMIQPFEYCVHLQKGETKPSFLVNAYKRDCSNPILRHKFLWRSFCSNHASGLNANTNYDVHGHVGLAWGIKREVYDKISGGLYDKALIGGADHIMAHAAAGHINHNCITKSFGEDISAVNDYSSKMYAAVGGKLGFTAGDVYHIWHGELKDRQYLKRITEFTPAAMRINKRDVNGFFIQEDEYDDNYMRNYFAVREVLEDMPVQQSTIIYNDDNNTIFGSSEQIEFGGGQSDGGGAGGSFEETIVEEPTISTNDFSDLPGFISNDAPVQNSDFSDLPGFITNDSPVDTSDYQSSTFS